MTDTNPAAVPSHDTMRKLSDHQLADRTRRRVAWTQRKFALWAQSNGHPSMPATEHTILQWLHIQRDHLAPMTLRSYADAVRSAHVMEGHPDPGGPRLAAYLVAVRKEAALAGRLRRPRVAAVDLRDVVTAVNAELARTDPAGQLLELRARVGLLLGRACQAPLRQLLWLGVSDIDIDDDDLTIQLPSTTLDAARRVHIVHDARDPLCPVRALRDYLPLLPPDTGRLLGILVKPPGPGMSPAVVASHDDPGSAYRVHETCLTTAARRAGLDVALYPYPSAGMSDADARWLLRFLNWQLLTQLRNRSYALLGFALGRRADELNNLTIGDILDRPDGIDVLLRSSKTDPDGDGDLLHLDHEEDNPTAGCAIYCPVRATLEWIDVMRRIWSVTSESLLFPAMKGGKRTPTGQLIAADASRILRQMLGREDISSRTMRASTITALRAENLPLDRIAAVSRHKSIEQLARYLRILDPHVDQYHLDV